MVEPYEYVVVYAPPDGPATVALGPDVVLADTLEGASFAVFELLPDEWGRCLTDTTIYVRAFLAPGRIGRHTFTPGDAPDPTLPGWCGVVLSE